MADLPPPAYEDAVHSNTNAGRPQDHAPSTHLDIPHNGIPPWDRRSMEDEGRSLPPGWIRQYDAKESHQFFVDTTANPPRSIWHHPHDDEQYLSTLTSEQRERLQATGNPFTDSEATAAAAAGAGAGEDAHQPANPYPSSPSASHSASNEVPDRPQGQEQNTGGLGKLGLKMVDKITGSTHEERERARRRRAEEEAEAYRRYQHIRSAMTRAAETGEPQLLGKNAEGKDVYIEPPPRMDRYSDRMYPGAHTAAGRSYYGYNPYMQGPYANPNSVLLGYPRPNYPYGRPRGRGYGGGMGVPLMGGLLGGMALGGLMW